MQQVSLCMIVKNEEQNLITCLNSIGSLFREVIIVDTGSTDRTKRVALEYTAKVMSFDWCDDFAAARNYALGEVTGDWVFWLDADDQLSALTRYRLRDLFDRLAIPKAYRVSVKSLGISTPPFYQIRLFSNHPQVRWTYRVHEQLRPSITSLDWEVIDLPIEVTHRGYADPVIRLSKLRRNLRLLKLDLEDHPLDPFVLYNLHMVYKGLGDLDSANHYLALATSCYWKSNLVLA